MDRGKIARNFMRRRRLDFPARTSLLCVAVAAAASAQEIAAVTLVADGRTTGCIVLPAGVDEVEGRVWTAAKDLAGYIKQMSGAHVPTRWDNERCVGFRLLIGSTTLAPVKLSDVSEKNVGFDGFIIRSVPNGVVIAGRTPQGTANGVYYFAEQVLGVRWFAMDQDGPTCPKRSTIQIPPLGLTVKPDFAQRQLAPYSIRRFMPKEELARWGRWMRFHRAGGIRAECGHIYDSIVPDRLFKTHPEYFPLIDGKRTLTGDHDSRCLSNPDVLRMAIDHTRRKFESGPGILFASLSPMDSTIVRWCQCENCTDMGPTPSHQALAFANAVAEANEDLYPDKGYIMLAYLATIEPPVGMKAHRSVVPMVAPMMQCRIHPIDSDCPSRVHVREIYRGWLDIAGRITKYDYFPLAGPFNGIVITMAEDLRFVRDSGGDLGGYRDYSGGPQAGFAMGIWMDVKLVWDVDQDPVKLRRQFIEGYYGRAASDPMERVYVHMENYIRTSPFGERPKGESNYGHRFWPLRYLAPAVEGCREDIEAAKKAVRSEPEIFRKRVERDMATLLGEHVAWWDRLDPP